VGGGGEVYPKPLLHSAGKTFWFSVQEEENIFISETLDTGFKT
jgi:hypothetical protein